MYSVTKKIEFCYGHRLLDYDGICKHPHGHNAVAEIEVRTDALDPRNMVCDFSDIKRVVKGWNPTVELIAKIIFDQAHGSGFNVVRVTVWETPTSFATYSGD
jgi:6-pyruvoyltetrahydropterin/6-carboxytetrahydropterin synthase